MSQLVSETVADVAAAVGKLRADDRVVTSPEVLLGEVEALLEAVTAIEAVVVRRLRDPVEVEATSELCGRSTRNWLVEEQRLAGPQASRLLRLARELPAAPATEAAFDAAEISTQHSAAILTALKTLPGDLRDTVEPHLVDRARTYPPEEIAGFVDELLQLLGIDTDSDIHRERRHNSRGIDLPHLLDGARSVSGRLTPEVAERLAAALAAAGQSCGAGDDRTARQRRHDALGVIADAYLAHADTPSFTGAPRTMIVHIDLDVLTARLTEALVTLPSGATISAATARRLACDAELVPAVLGGRSEVLDIGVADHEFTTAIRRAAYIRDHGRCAFPGCRNRYVELHHLVFRRHHGPTSLDNAAWLCAYHHWLVHEGRWTLQRAHHGGYLWTGPHGQQTERHLQTAQPSAPIAP